VGWVAVSTAVRRLPAGRQLPRLLPERPRLTLASAPDLRLLTPPRVEVAERRHEGVAERPPLQSDSPDDKDGPVNSNEVIIRDRTKSSEVVALTSLPDWEAELRDKGHKRGYVIRIRRPGESDPVETIQAEGLLRAAARDLATEKLKAYRSFEGQDRV
jgi:hypothetical protein